MSLQAEGAGGGQSAPASGRRRLWSTVLLCFGGRHNDKETAAARPRRRKRTVPVDSAGDEAVYSPASPARRRRGCGFLLPLSSCVPGPKRNVKGSDRQRRQELVTAAAAPPSRNAKAPPPPRHDVAPATARGGGGGAIAETGAAPPRTATRLEAAGAVAVASDGVAREFGPAVGVCVVAAVSMAGLIGGRIWAIVCVCAWFAALYGLRLKRWLAAAPAARGSLAT